MKRLAIVGGGSWGTALAVALSSRSQQVRLWIYESDLAGRMTASRENDIFLPGVQLPANIIPSCHLEEVLETPDIVLSVMPSHHVRGLATRMAPLLHPQTPLVSATKGIENHTLQRTSEVLADVLGGPERIAVLSGPTFAREIAQGKPAAVVIASTNSSLATDIQSAFCTPTLRLYTNADPIGVEVGASLKNVIAIAAGVCDGLQLGSNATAALITRGLAEITRLAIAMGGKPLTLMGLAGLGDLVLTCTGQLSRNRTLGQNLAAGKPLAELLASSRMVAEGVQTTYAALDLGRKFQVDLPIIAQVGAILNGEKSLFVALRDLMDRSLKGE
ncbi:MAG: NAD(P)-dependent glycerol-3-phosphate dehydrogenase [Acidobacteria bacterium]|nr:NAD(P)-dependent glycerol-3-phosphate dehydrogenase [Acidobacteriota bacterium]